VQVTTHQELSPCSFLSFVANLIPFSDHNQSPRNVYQCQVRGFSCNKTKPILVFCVCFYWKKLVSLVPPKCTICSDGQANHGCSGAPDGQTGWQQNVPVANPPESSGETGRLRFVRSRRLWPGHQCHCGCDFLYGTYINLSDFVFQN